MAERATINHEALVATAVVGLVTSPAMGESPYDVGADGAPFVPVGAGGVCYNVAVGMPAMGWAADQVEPGASISHPDAGANDALNAFACVGNRVAVRTGTAAGATGTVTGKHEAFRAYRHVLVHLDGGDLERLVPGDQLVVRAVGRGMAVREVPGVACHSLGPELWSAWAPAVSGGALEVAVTRVLPPEVVGMGSGRLSTSTSVAVQTKDDAIARQHDLAGLRIGDLVALCDWDATYVTGYRRGAVSVGVVTTGDSPAAGNGPALTLLLAAADGSIRPHLDAGANLSTLLGLG
jgi:hypothetical protein